jgi:dethiobiotin synthetase
MKQTLFITGTDTGVGKTVLTALLVKFLRERGPACGTAALKPVCSGGRGDARKIFAAMNGALTLDEINPWHFCAAIAPLLAARREKKKIRLSQVLAHVRAMQRRFEVLLVEGAGGLLSPLGEGFNSRDLILALRAMPIIVAQNKLGAVSQILLTLEALPKNLRAKSRVVLVSPRKPDASTKTNAKLLAEFFDAEKIFLLPRDDNSGIMQLTDDYFGRDAALRRPRPAGRNEGG